MPTLRLKFPEKEEPTLIVLSGARVTLGRLPLNTIQIVDRTLSGFHAEFIFEEDHYRLHDRGSTNGTYVNGEPVTDFHLREACKVSFGSLECEFSPEATPAPDAANVEALPTRSEINAVRQENAELKSRVDSLREEIAALNKARTPETGSGAAVVERAEFEKVAAERDSLKETQEALNREIDRLKNDLSQLQRDRENLKKVAETAKAEIAEFQAPAPAEPEKPAVPAIVEESKPEPAAEAAPAPSAAPEPPVAPAPEEKPAPPMKPPVALPKPGLPLPAAAKLAPKPPGTLPPPPGRLPTAPGAKPAAGVTPEPKPVPASGIRPVAKPIAPAPKGGTQKIGPEAIKPVVPPAKPVSKPPMKLPLQPTVKLQPSAPPSKPGGKDDAG